MLNAFPFLSFQKKIIKKKNKRGENLKERGFRVFEENLMGLGQKEDKRKGRGKRRGILL
jgi:hypothetical protein